MSKQRSPISAALMAAVTISTIAASAEVVLPLHGPPHTADTTGALMRLKGANASACMAWLKSLRKDKNAVWHAWQIARQAAGMAPLPNEAMRDRLPYMRKFFTTAHGGLVIRASQAQVTCECSLPPS